MKQVKRIYWNRKSHGKFQKIITIALKLDQFNLKLCSGWYGANLRKNSRDEKKLIQEQLKLFKDCNSPCIVFAEVGSIQGDPNRKLSTRPQMEKDEWNEFCKKFLKWENILRINNAISLSSSHGNH